MVNKKSLLLIAILLSLLALTPGCIDMDFYTSSDHKDKNIITYGASPTKISYYISYGCRIQLNGTGEYNIRYNLNLPETLKGSYKPIVYFNENYENKTVSTFNQIKSWNISGYDSNKYTLGLEAYIESETFMVSDLRGTDALTLTQIKKQKPEILEQYCHSQTHDNISYINPDLPEIKNISNSIKNESKTDNSFQLAKQLFIWLKTNTKYQPHNTSFSVQTSYETLKKKTGDCDDLSFLYISLCRSIGIPARFISGFSVEQIDNNTSATGHAWVEIYVGNQLGYNGWIPVECAGKSNDIQAQIQQNFGVETARHLRLYKDDGSNHSLNFFLTNLRVRYDKRLEVTENSFQEIEEYQIIERKKLYVDNEEGCRTLQL
ncbi:MAG: transglutaminase-like domain-containing protein [Candidatus Thermoplasmatota archaeon]